MLSKNKARPEHDICIPPCYINNKEGNCVFHQSGWYYYIDFAWHGPYSKEDAEYYYIKAYNQTHEDPVEAERFDGWQEVFFEQEGAHYHSEGSYY